MRNQVDLDALFIGSTMHGLAGVMSGNCVDKLDLRPKAPTQATAHVMNMMSLRLASKRCPLDLRFGPNRSVVGSGCQSGAYASNQAPAASKPYRQASAYSVAKSAKERGACPVSA